MLVPLAKQWQSEGLISSDDLRKIQNQYDNTNRKTLNVIPGFAISRAWNLDTVIVFGRTGRYSKNTSLIRSTQPLVAGEKHFNSRKGYFNLILFVYPGAGFFLLPSSIGLWKKITLSQFHKSIIYLFKQFRALSNPEVVLEYNFLLQREVHYFGISEVWISLVLYMICNSIFSFFKLFFICSHIDLDDPSSLKLLGFWIFFSLVTFNTAWNYVAWMMQPTLLFIKHN